MEIVAADVGDGEAEFVVGNDGDERAVAEVEMERLADVPGLAGGFLFLNASFLNQGDKGSGGAVGDGGLVGIHLDEGVVDAHADQRGEDVFDGVDAVGADGEGGGALDGLHKINISGDERLVG